MHFGADKRSDAYRDEFDYVIGAGICLDVKVVSSHPNLKRAASNSCSFFSSSPPPQNSFPILQTRIWTGMRSSGFLIIKMAPCNFVTQTKIVTFGLIRFDIMDDEKGLIIYNTPDGRSKVALMARDGMVWLNQQSIAELFGTSVPNISMHISNIFKDNELDKQSVVKDYLTTAADGKPYHVMFYSLPMIIAIGYKVKGVRGVQFRRWAIEHFPRMRLIHPTAWLPSSWRMLNSGSRSAKI